MPTAPDWERIAGDDSFISRYMQYMSATETATAYDFMCALWVMGSVLGRRTYIARPSAPVFFNMYMILVAESGITRKSTSISAATALVRAASKSIELVQDRLTPEALQHRMSQISRRTGGAHVAISFSELAAALGKGHGISGMPAVLTDLYDCPESREGGGTKGDVYRLRNVFLSFMSASTPAWLRRAVNPDIISGGFTSRCLFVRSEKPKRRIAWGIDEGNEVRAAQFRQLVQFLQGLRTIKDPFDQLTPAAHTAFCRWYETRPAYKDPYRSSFASREDGHVLRIAGLLAISTGSRLINTHDIQNAIAIVTYLREDTAQLFDMDDGPVQTPDELVGIDKLRDMLVQAGKHGLRQAAITKKLARLLNGAQIGDLLGIMHETAMVQKFQIQDGWGRPATLWRATKLMLDRDANNLLLHRATTNRTAAERLTGVVVPDGSELSSEQGVTPHPILPSTNLDE